MRTWLVHPTDFYQSAGRVCVRVTSSRLERACWIACPFPLSIQYNNTYSLTCVGRVLVSGQAFDFVGMHVLASHPCEQLNSVGSLFYNQVNYHLVTYASTHHGGWEDDDWEECWKVCIRM